jgi:DNA polymerase-3 subunit delta'
VSDDAEERADEEAAAPHPRETSSFFGHREAEQALLAAYRGGRIPHAVLIGGPQGIGKATLAYRMAKFVLAHPDPASAAVAAAQDLSVDAGNPAARRVAMQSHPDLLTIERSTTRAGCASRSPSRTSAAASPFSARPQARGAGASGSWTRSTR